MVGMKAKRTMGAMKAMKAMKGRNAKKQSKTRVTAAVAAAITAIGVGAATAAIVAEIVVGIALSAALSEASKAIAGKPKSLNDRGQTLSFRSPTAAAQVVYGETRVSGPIVFMSSTGYGYENDNRFLWISVALAGHEVDAIGEDVVDEQPMSKDQWSPGQGQVMAPAPSGLRSWLRNQPAARVKARWSCSRRESCWRSRSCWGPSRVSIGS
jgi:hypothetical protein